MFDPYHKWLGIPPGRRPPTPYQLLAISESEKDRDVIEAATVRQSAYVRNFQKGENGELASRILAEISEAREVLTDAARRRALDESLAAEKPKVKATAAALKSAPAAVQAVVVKASPVTRPQPAKAPVVKSSSRRKKAGVSIPILVGILVVVAGASGVGVYLATRPTTTQQTASADDQTKNQSPSPPSPARAPEFNPPPQFKEKLSDRPQFPTNVPMPGPPPGFGRPPSFGPPGNIGVPKGFTPPPGLFKGQGDSPQNSPNKTPARNQGGKSNRQGGNGTEPPSRSLDALDDLLVRLQTGGLFERESAAKELLTTKVDDEKKTEVAKVVNELLLAEQQLPDSVFDAAAIFGDDQTVSIIADKLRARPWVDRNAIRAAGKMKNPKLALPLCVLLENFFNWEDATRALQQMGPAAEDHVRRLITHRDPKMRAQVCLILATIGTKKSLPALRKAAGDKFTADAAKAAIQEISERVKAEEHDEPEEKKPEK